MCYLGLWLAAPAFLWNLAGEPCSVPVHSMLPAAWGAALQGSRFDAVTMDLIHIKEPLQKGLMRISRRRKSSFLNAALTIDAEQRPGSLARPVLALESHVKCTGLWIYHLSCSVVPRTCCIWLINSHGMECVGSSAATWLFWVSSGLTGLVASLLPDPKVDALKCMGFPLSGL